MSDEMMTQFDYVREAYGDPCPGCGTLRWQADCPKCYREDDLPPAAPATSNPFAEERTADYYNVADVFANWLYDATEVHFEQADRADRDKLAAYSYRDEQTAAAESAHHRAVCRRLNEILAFVQEAAR